MRILAVDPGEKRIGLAISDPSGTIAQPLTTLRHVSRSADAAAIASLARQHEVACIVVGQALDEENRPTVQGRRASRLAAALRAQLAIPVILWDEYGSTLAARAALLQEKLSKRRQRAVLDEAAATYILQSYLDSLSQKPPTHPPEP